MSIKNTLSHFFNPVRNSTAEQDKNRVNSIFTSNFKPKPYWHDDEHELQAMDRGLPIYADVLVIGSGYTGLHTALQTARAGRSTVVIDSGNIGQGCSTRNGGQISTSVKPSIDSLARRFGLERARAIQQEGETALQWIEAFISSESIDCNFIREGRFHAAHTPSHYETLSFENDKLRQEGIEVYSVPKSDQIRELGTDFYHGGVVFPRHASLHASKYHWGLLAQVIKAGSHVIQQCTALTISQNSNQGDQRFLVKTNRGEIRARNLMVATNGYTGGLTPWLQRRIIPIGSYIIATDVVQKDLMDTLFPTNKVVSDTRRVVYYFRPSPDRTRILFGGRVSADESDYLVCAPRLHREMCRIFPQLKHSQISHCWSGTVGYTFDTLAHTGQFDGIHYALGYCGSGVSMASYLGMRAGQKILEMKEGQTAFDNLPFPSKPLYRGKPWFLPAVVFWYRWRDQIECQRACQSKP